MPLGHEIFRRSAILSGAAVLAAPRGWALPAYSNPPVFIGSRHQYASIQPADPAPIAQVMGLDGRPFRAAQRLGRVLVLNFWATWCAPCVRELASLEALASAVLGQPIDVAAVSIDLDASVVRRFVHAHNLGHVRVLLDPDQTLGSLRARQVDEGALPLWGLPMTYAIDPLGRVVGFLTGPADWASPQARRLLAFLAAPRKAAE